MSRRAPPGASPDMETKRICLSGKIASRRGRSSPPPTISGPSDFMSPLLMRVTLIVLVVSQVQYSSCVYGSMAMSKGRNLSTFSKTPSLSVSPVSWARLMTCLAGCSPFPWSTQ